MTWFKVDDGFTTSKQVLSIPRKYRCGAVGLWTLVGSWCARELTDGQVPDYVPEEFTTDRNLVGWLVKSGLWEVVDGGWQYVNWHKYNPTKEKVLADRKAESDRKARWRDAKANRKVDEVTTSENDSFHSSDGEPASSEERANSASRQQGNRRSNDSVRNVSHRDNTVSQASVRQTSVLPDPTRPDPLTSTYVGSSPHVSNAHEKTARATPAKTAPPEGWRLVRDELDTNALPGAALTELAIRTAALLDEGQDPHDVRAALRRWSESPGKGPGLLPHLLSDIIRERSKPRTPTSREETFLAAERLKDNPNPAVLQHFTAAEPKAIL